MCTNHYVECWTDRNEKFHDPAKQRQYVIEWMNEIEAMILRSNRIDAIRCVRNHSIRVDNATTKQIQARNSQLLEVHKKAKERKESRDIMSFFPVKSKMKKWQNSKESKH